ncbi:MAG: PIG-L family deacetylase [Ignavibacteria bacterium]|nr:PIG-L family deacetylase [Ignavibacteria bacterium]
MAILITMLFVFCGLIQVRGQSVLIVAAHPADEGACAAMIYRITKELGGSADLVVITNGENGYKYSTLAENVYGKPLTTADTSRKYLPEIRKKELLAAVKWIGIRNVYFLDQTDSKLTLDADGVLNTVWNVSEIQRRLEDRMTSQQYDFILTMLPLPETHSNQKAASIVVLQTFEKLVKERRFPGKEVPAILGMTNGGPESLKLFRELKSYPITAIDTAAQVFVFDRTQSFGYDNKLDYTVIARWHAAEYKSQGALQNVDVPKAERYMLFKVNRGSARGRAKWLFNRVQR